MNRPTIWGCHLRLFRSRPLPYPIGLQSCAIVGWVGRQQQVAGIFNPAAGEERDDVTKAGCALKARPSESGWSLSVEVMQNKLEAAAYWRDPYKASREAEHVEVETAATFLDSGGF